MNIRLLKDILFLSVFIKNRTIKGRITEMTTKQHVLMYRVQFFCSYLCGLYVKKQFVWRYVQRHEVKTWSLNWYPALHWKPQTETQFRSFGLFLIDMSTEYICQYNIPNYNHIQQDFKIKHRLKACIVKLVKLDVCLIDFTKRYAFI